ncbi:hypothetical protein B296_00044711 [Ensete ventricosum]|uniref:Uncharacterized protein n=1 Tax=Ensete ventricosum TaxID=4639 RepID=A0A426X553_ENSVE|nr:hypothetical protein B296_00044711 [Ensete ventricosum]
MCNKFNTLLDPEGYSGDCISKGMQSSKCIYGDNGAQILAKCDPTVGMIRAAGELDCFSAHFRLREPGKSEDKAECKAIDSRAMGLTAPWYRRGGTSVESSIPCTHGGRALIVKGAKEVENAMTNSKYQDRMKGQRPRNFIRPMSMGF